MLDERALLACMVYVDLNPVRAGVAANLEDSDFTSIQARLHAYQAERQVDTRPMDSTKNGQSLPLMLFQPSVVSDPQPTSAYIPFQLDDYLELVDWTGRHYRADKSGCIADDTPKILDQFNLPEKSWLDSVKGYGQHYYAFVGAVQQLRELSRQFGQQWLCGGQLSQTLYAERPC